MNTFIDTAVKSKAQAVVLGAESSILRAQFHVRRRAVSLRYILANAPVRSGTTNTYDVLTDLNATLWREISGRQMNSNNSGYMIVIMGPPTTLEAYRQQDPQEQHSDCTVFCRRDENAAFTNISMFAMFRDEVEGKPVEHRHFYSAGNFSNDVVLYNLSIETSSQIRPSWAQSGVPSNDGGKDITLQHHWRIGNVLRTISPLTSYGNGSLFEGGWTGMTVTSSQSGNSYYLTTFRQVFLHPTTNLTIAIAAIVNVKVFQSILTSHASASLGPDNRLMVVDEIPRVVSYNRDPFGDSRLGECVITTAPGTVGRNCGDLYAVDHPSAFVRWLFSMHMSFIMDGQYEEETGEKWITYLDDRHLVVVKEILHQGTVRLIAVSVLSEKSVVGTVRETAIILVVIFAFVVAAGCAMLSCAGMLTLSSAQSTVELVAKLADCIACYDVDAADEVIADAQKQRRCCNDATAMEVQFSQIIENLRLYRPYLPASLTLDDSSSNEDDVFNENWFDKANSTPSGSLHVTEKGSGQGAEKSIPSMSVQVLVRSPNAISPDGSRQGPVGASTLQKQNIFSIEKELETSVRGGRLVSKQNPSAFRPFSGSLLLVDFGNLPAGANIRRGNLASTAGITHIIHLFLDTCIHKAKVHRGVVEAIRANQVLISFNCHRPISDHANVAALCALALRTCLNELVVSNKVLTTSLQLFRMNTTVSVTNGTGIVGTAGTSSTKSRVLAGEPMDLIYTLPPLQRILGVGILICNNTCDGLLSSTFVTIPTQVIHPFRTGYHSQHVSTVYELVGTTHSTPSSKLNEVKVRTEIFRLMYTGGKTSRIVNLLNSHNQTSPSLITPFWKTHLAALVDSWESKSIKTVNLRPRAMWGWDPIEGRVYHDTVRLRAFSLLYTTSDNLLTSCSAAPNPQDERLMANKQLQTFKADALAARVTSTQQSTFVEVMSRSYDAQGTSVGDVDEFSGPLFSMFVQPSHSRRGPTIPPAAQNASSSKSSDLPSQESDAKSATFYFMSSDVPYVGGLSSGSASSGASKPSSSSLIVAVNKDRYFVTNKLIGKGAFGSVVLALHETGGLVAMKQIPLTVLNEGVEPLIQEMELLSSLNHPNIASYVTCAVNKSDNTFCIMTEYLAAGSLYDLIKISSPAVPPRIAIKNAREIASGLHYLHTRNPPILHLDVKPENVLMSADGCKLIDFGTSKFFSEADKSISVRGTPRYMAPEAALGEFSPASDVYSLGITVLHMLMGRPPWDHVPGDDNSFMMRLARDETLRPDIPEWIDRPLRSLLQLCTSRDPKVRPTAKGLLGRLDALLIDAHAKVVPTVVPYKSTTSATTTPQVSMKPSKKNL